MDLEFHQIELRYEALRTRSATREARLLASLAEGGQQVPVVVVTSGEHHRYVLVDGYKRVRALRRLGRDTVRAMAWDLEEAEALLVERLMRSGDGAGALEEGWLLAELRDRFGMAVEELGKRFDRSASWVSRRLGLVGELPLEIQEQVRRGEIAAHAAMRHLVPLARANVGEAIRLAAAIGPHRPTSREVGTLCAGWLSGSEATRRLLVEDPRLFLRARAQARSPADPAEAGPAAVLLEDMGALGGIARRGIRHLREGLLARLLGPEREEVGRALAQARADVERLVTTHGKEALDARPDDAGGDPALAT
jgi:ParB/RepB/Spo0J family partition protein